MLYDLNIPWSPTTSPSDLDRTLSFAAHLGYSVVALNHTLPPPIPSTISNPLPVLPPPPQDKSSAKDRSNKHPTVLRRATVPISDPSTNHRLPQVAAAYDLVALRPTTERAFLAACTTLSAENFSLVSLDLAAFHPFHFPPRACMAAVARGLRFEICYGQFLAASGKGDDARARSNFLGNVAGLIRATKGRGLVVSSGAPGAGSGALGLRAPADVVNLLAVWGLGTERGKAAMGENARGVVVNEGIRRRGFRGVVDVLGGAGEEQAGRERGAGEEDSGGAKEKGKGKGKKQKGQGQGGQDKGLQGQKRRSEEGQAEVADADAPLSKRQAKRMKLAALKGKPAEK